MHIYKIVSMFKIFCMLCFVATFSNFLKLTNSMLDLYFGCIARLLQRGQTAVLFGAAGHGPVCFLSTVEFIWARGYKHMNGPQCAGSVLTSPHQCAWDTLVKTGTHHGLHVFQREPSSPLKDQSVVIWTTDRFVWLICATLSSTIAESTAHWKNLSIYLSI